MADNKIPYARRHPYKAILWFVVLPGSFVGLIGAASAPFLWLLPEILAVVVVLIALIGLIRLGYHREWTGFGTAEISKPGDKEIRPRKTLWDWLGLLIVPGVLAVESLTVGMSVAFGDSPSTTGYVLGKTMVGEVEVNARVPLPLTGGPVELWATPGVTLGGLGKLASLVAG